MTDKLITIEKKLVKLKEGKVKEYLLTLDKKTIEKLVTYLSNKYYQPKEGEESVVSDEKFDLVKERFNELFPKKHVVGAKLRESDNSAKLPYYLGSLDKVKPENEDKLEKWLSEFKNPNGGYVISEKLDGISCLLVHDSSSSETKLYTRGDGETGKDISYLLPDITTIPDLDDAGDIAIRGELIVSKENFEKIKEENTGDTRLYKNPRNMVAGITGAKTARLGLSVIDYVVYEIVGSGERPSPLENFEELENMGFKVAKHEVVEEIDIQILSNLLTRFRKESEYEIDGIVVQGNTEYFRNESGNPDYAFAFKLPGQTIIATVEKVKWEVSKHGYIKPVVVIEPIELGGVTISKATGFNAKFIKDNEIGEGAEVEIIRSGEVIPYILSVVKPAEGGADMPPEDTYTWNETGVDIITTDLDSSEICVKIINNFMKELDIKFVSEATIQKLFENGLNSLFKILGADVEDFAKIEGLGKKSGERIHNNIHERLQKGLTMEEVMASSGLFGFGIGKRKLKLLTKKFPNPIDAYDNLGKEEFERKINEIEGYAEKTVKRISNNMEAFREYLTEILKFIKLLSPHKVSKINAEINGKKVVFSGFRDNELRIQIEDSGGNVMTSVSGNTDILLVADVNSLSGKAQKAKEKGVEIMEREEFVKKYLNNDKEEESEDSESEHEVEVESEHEVEKEIEDSEHEEEHEVEEESEKDQEEHEESEEVEEHEVEKEQSEEENGDWENGDPRSFAFDPNSTKNEGRYRLINPKDLHGYFRIKDKKEKGIGYVMGKDEDNKSRVQAIRFDLKVWDEDTASKWWNDNAERFGR
jgi:DNA ligase (NAD+)